MKIDTSAYEFKVIISKIDEDHTLREVSFVDNNEKVVSIHKYRAKTKKKGTLNNVQ